MNLFYCDDIPEKVPLPLVVKLGEDESRHALKVLRLGPGDSIRVTNGRGYHYMGTIQGTVDKSLEIRLTEEIPLFDFTRPRMHLAVSPLKNPDRLEWLVEKATEAGIYMVSFMLTHRTEKRGVNIDRLKRITVAALKQSLGGWLPVLKGPVKFDSLINETDESEKFIALCDGQHPLLWDALSGQQDAVILVGPEGDFTPEEAAMAIAAGFKPVSLGKHRLRTETAGLVSIFAFQMKSRNL